MSQRPRQALEKTVLGQQTLDGAVKHGDITIGGDAKALSGLWALLVDFQIGFPVVAPPG
jgi:alkyl sulfatase BDS1-like metallo-beta-lactamase superfamily hydrolase